MSNANNREKHLLIVSWHKCFINFFANGTYKLKVYIDIDMYVFIYVCVSHL